MGKSRREWRPLKPPPIGYYVYEWFRKDDNHVFYVGKGKGDRVVRTMDSHRNNYFLRYIEKYDCDYRIIKDSLTEQEAYILENEIYQERKANGECECNLSDTSPCNGGSALPGNLNGMYGKTHSYENRKKISEINIEYNKSHINSNAHKTIAYNLETKTIKIFDCKKDCMEWLKKNESNFKKLSEMTCYRIISYSHLKKYSYFSWCFKEFPRETIINEDDTVSSFNEYVPCRKTTYRSTHSYEEDITTKERQRSFYYKDSLNRVK